MAAKRNVDFIRQFADQLTKANTFDSVMRRLKIVGGGDGKCVAEIRLEQEDLNMRNSIHGGFIATAMNNLSTYAMISKSLQPVRTIDMQIMFMRTAPKGEDLIIEANTVNYENNVAYVECEIRGKSDGGLVAKGGESKMYKSLD